MGNYKKFLTGAFIFFTLVFSAHAAPKVEKQPKWVTDYSSVYPENEWVVVPVVSAPNKQAAEANAIGALAAVFKVDVQAASSAAQSMSQTLSNGKSELGKNSSLASQTNTSTSVSGLMGVVIDSWTSKDGTVYALARINRKSGAAAYAGIIKENDSVILALEKDAAANPGTFEAYESLAVASNLAVLTDGYLEILSVLNPAVRASVTVGYGNANAVKRLALDNTRSIVIRIEIKGDVNGRIKKAFQEVFTKQGFRTSDAPAANAYTLDVDFTISPVDLQGQSNKFARYELNAAIGSAGGTELFAFSGNSRVGHTSYSEAEQRTLRRAESSIGDIDDEESFTSVFNSYLVSLLK
ncbi:MAG: LPP20 family lipoprotein [Treponema sp.]|jgi:hypothetical protein|nr:LPP20 family lipoprotein [Treponema sp.]